ncbi:unnamed protein product [Arabis nemorensis]|uniref:Uncharacterized protein n=1 Tax=Arabis nemorensis TaxID=586526 RepID=A0A565BTD7_9BRAS|nr:unnamed protein product [Arabis nemorensis]
MKSVSIRLEFEGEVFVWSGFVGFVTPLPWLSLGVSSASGKSFSSSFRLQ